MFHIVPVNLECVYAEEPSVLYRQVEKLKLNLWHTGSQCGDLSPRVMCSILSVLAEII